MKRIVALLLTLLLACLGFGAAAASDVLTVTAEDCAPGATITLSFGVAKNSNIAAADFAVTFDTDTFEYVSYENGPLLKNTMAVGNLSGGQFLFAMAGTEPLTDEGVLFTVEFLVDSAASGAHEFAFIPTDCYNADVEPMTVSRASATVTVSGEAVSDVKVTPATSQTEDGSTVTVSAGTPAPSTLTVSGNPGGEAAPEAKMGGLSRTAVICIVVGAVLLLICLLILLAVLRAKKMAAQPQEEVAPILSEDARALLELDDDALQNQSLDEDDPDDQSGE